MSSSEWLAYIVYMLVTIGIGYVYEKKGNFSVENRSFQFLMPIFALLYLVSLLILGQYTETHHPDFIKPWALNFLFVLIFFVCKLVILLLTRRYEEKLDPVHAFFADHFYRFNSDTQFWELQNAYYQVKVYLRGIYYLLIAVTFTVVYLDIVPFLSFPVLGLLVVAEFAFYLGGLSGVEQSDAQPKLKEEPKLVDFAAIQEKLASKFAEFKLLHYATDTTAVLEYDNESVLKQEALSADPIRSMVANHLLKESDKGIRIEDTYFESSVDLMEGKSVLFATPFYRDITPALFLPVHRNALNMKKCLVLVGRESIEEDIVEWVYRGLTSVTEIPGLWTCGILQKDLPIDYEVLVLPYNRLMDLEMMNSQAEILGKVGMVILIEPSRFISEYQFGLTHLVNFFNSEQQAINVAAIDSNQDGIVDALSHIFKVNIKEVTATPRQAKKEFVMYWDMDKSNTTKKIFPTISRYLGGVPEMASEMIKQGAKRTNWYSHSAFAVKDMAWIVGQYYKVLTAYMGLPNSQRALEQKMKFLASIWGASRPEENCIFIEDELNHAFEMGRQFSTRAGNQVFVNVLSPNYMLRDYMIHNHAIFTDDPKAIPSISPDTTLSRRNTVIQLVKQLIEAPVSEAYVEQHLQIKHDEANDLRAQLEAEIRGFFPTNEEELISVEHVQYLEELDLAMREKKFYRLNQHAFMTQYEDIWKSIEIHYENDEEKLNSIKPIGYIYQNYLPGQLFSIAGKQYEVFEIQPHGPMKLRRAADHIHRRQYYRQIRTYAFKSWEQFGNAKYLSNDDKVSLLEGLVHMNVTTDGYYTCTSFHDLASAHRTRVPDVPERQIVNKEALCLHIEGATPTEMFTLAKLLNEMFYTVYPHHHQYIRALYSNVDLNTPEAIIQSKVLGTVAGDCIYIVEDAQMDLGIIESIQRYMHRFLEMLTDYLDWYMQDSEAAANGYFLYGYPQLDPALDLKGLHERLAASGFADSAYSRTRQMVNNFVPEPEEEVEVAEDAEIAEPVEDQPESLDELYEGIYDDEEEGK